MTDPGSTYHVPVLAERVLQAAGDARRVVDATLGGGGHSALFRERGMEVLAIDRDPDASGRRGPGWASRGSPTSKAPTATTRHSRPSPASTPTSS